VIRCVYTDIDGTLVGPGGSLFHDREGAWTMLPARALEACSRAGVEVVLKSGRRRESVRVLARALGQPSWIYEVGCGLVIDGDEQFLTGDLKPTPERNIFEQITDSGAVDLLFEHFDGLEYHAPWHEGRDISHLLRGRVDAAAADALLAEHGHGELRLVDNGVLAGSDGEDERRHAYHLMPRGGSKLRAVARHMQARGYAREECIAIGDSREDLEVAEVVGRFFLVANAVEADPGIGRAAAERANVTVCEDSHGDGFYEAVVRSLAEAR
jgi:hydroxymethylpyrimidine pyrophosphatase-like HAD family hydrolase